MNCTQQSIMNKQLVNNIQYVHYLLKHKLRNNHISLADGQMDIPRSSEAALGPPSYHPQALDSQSDGMDCKKLN